MLAACKKSRIKLLTINNTRLASTGIDEETFYELALLRNLNTSPNQKTTLSNKYIILGALSKMLTHRGKAPPRGWMGKIEATLDRNRRT